MHAGAHDDYDEPQQKREVGRIKIDQSNPTYRLPKQTNWSHSAERQRDSKKARQLNSKIIEH